MDALLVSTLAVAIAEIGDKTQLLALVLAARYRRALPVIAGILVATVLNHAAAAWVGAWVAGWLDPAWLRWIVVACFLGVAVWALIPDKLDEDGTPAPPRFGPFLATTIAFFLVEMGDKTQVATAALAARFENIAVVAAGTTLGMMLANGPAVLIGEAAAGRLPLKAIRIAAAVAFAAVGVWILVTG